VSFRIREAKAEDIGFICDTWRGSFQHTSLVFQAAGVEAYRKVFALVTGRLLKGASAVVACDAEDEDALLGHAVHTGPELHYVYVRGGEPADSLRKVGIARALLEPLGITSYTWTTKSFEARLKPAARGWKEAPRNTL
jgi:hypothetical protein